MSPILRFFGVSEASFNFAVAGLGVAGFVTSWVYIQRQRSSGGSRRELIKGGIERLVDRLRRSDRVFASPQSAQFWFEWRRSGSIFPILTASLLVGAIAPVSWYVLDDAVGSLRTLIVAAFMPLLLALPLGKAFCKPDYWSTDVAVSGFIAVRPIASVDIVAAKMKVAALTTVLSWFPVLAFLAMYLTCWANPETITMIHGFLKPIYPLSALSQYGIGILGGLAMMLMTWRFLITGFWLGLSGNRRLFALSSIPYAVVPLFVLPATLIMIQTNSTVLAWMRMHASVVLNALILVLAAAGVLKCALAAISWRGHPPSFRNRYLTTWCIATAVLVGLAMIVSSTLESGLPFKQYPLHSLAILISLLAVPLARVGAGPYALDRNRHRA
jgi:hypothetical protein